MFPLSTHACAFQVKNLITKYISEAGEAAEDLVIPREDLVNALAQLDMNVYNNVFINEQNGQGAPGWLRLGPHLLSFMQGRDFHLVSTGHGDIKANPQNGVKCLIHGWDNKHRNASLPYATHY